MKVKEFYTKYVNYIVIVLMLIIGLKSCQRCSMTRQLHYSESKHSEYVDSLQSDIHILMNTVDSLKYEIQTRDSEISYLKENNKSLTDANKHYRTTNSDLVRTNKNIISKMSADTTKK